MLYFVDGKNGNGKSLFSMRRIVLMLEATQKTIVTNQDEIKLDEMNEFLAKRAIRRGVPPPDLHDRLVIIKKEDTPEYYRFRAGGLVLPQFNELDPETGKKIRVDEFREAAKNYFMPVKDQEREEKGVVYFLDEAQDYFGARDYMSNGRMTSWHIGKHRHLNDDVYWMTPCYEEVDAALRRKCHQWFRLVNMHRLKFKGFKAPGGFKAFVYYSEPRPGQEPSETISFDLGEGYENLYETTNALGVRGKPETKPPGWAPPFWSMVVAGCLLVVAGFFVLRNIPKLVGMGIGHSLSSMNAGMLGSMAHSNLGPVHPVTASEGSLVPEPQRRGVATDSGPGAAPGGVPFVRRFYSGVMADRSGLRVFSIDSDIWVEVSQVIPGPSQAVIDSFGEVLYPEPSAHAKSRVASSLSAGQVLGAISGPSK